MNTTWTISIKREMPARVPDLSFLAADIGKPELMVWVCKVSAIYLVYLQPTCKFNPLGRRTC